MGNNGMQTWTPWSDEDSKKLVKLCKASERPFVRDQLKISNADWEKIAKIFPGRSPVGCKQRYGFMKAKAEGRVAATYYKTKDQYRTREEIKQRYSPREAIPLPASITAFVFGDPLPGRSALDRKREGASA